MKWLSKGGTVSKGHHMIVIKKDTNLGPPDSDSPQKNASGDI